MSVKVPPRAEWRDVLDTQLTMIRWVESAPGQRWMRAKQHAEGQEYQEDTRIMQTTLFAGVPDQLRSGTPIFVSSDMCDLVEAAAPSFEPEPLHPTDLVDLTGFLLYERPFIVPNRFDAAVNIRALSWQPVLSTSKDGEYMDVLDGVIDEIDLMQRLEDRHKRGSVDGIALTIYAEPDPGEWEQMLARGVPMPPIEPLHITPWWWGMSFEGNDVTAAGIPTGAEWWWRIAQTTFRLMQQHIAVRRQERPFRPQRRDAQRMGLPPEKQIVVVTLRRERSAERHEPENDANYSHRFIVGGHWRNQWYPSAEKHRQIWIAPYVKGPEDKPLVVKPRAYAWVR